MWAVNKHAVVVRQSIEPRARINPLTPPSRGRLHCRGGAAARRIARALQSNELTAESCTPVGDQVVPLPARGCNSRLRVLQAKCRLGRAVVVKRPSIHTNYSQCGV